MIHPVAKMTHHWKTKTTGQAFARQMAQRMQAQTSLADCLISLAGELGAGKSTFARYLLQALGVREHIKSPSYAVVESYRLPALNQAEAWHCDFYRFQDPMEWEDSGLRDIFSSPGLKLVEWPSLAQGLLPIPDLTLELDFADPGRLVHWQAFSATGKTLLNPTQVCFND